MNQTLDLEKEITQAAHRHLNDPRVPGNLKESILYSLLAPGKRIRPRLAIACGEMIGLPKEAALAAGMACEFFHCSTLIHDDLPCMDNDDFRRGKPSNHKQFGESLALLAGDALMFMSLDVLAQASPWIKAEHFQKGLLRFLDTVGARGVMGGQARESLLSDKSKLEDLRLMHAGKTGALFEASLDVPMDFHGIDQSSEKGRAIVDFAKAIGLGFQVADDLEDCTQDAQRAGDREKEEITPLNVLYYQSAEEAGLSTKKMMEAAETQLRNQFAEGAATLLAISNEVKKRL